VHQSLDSIPTADWYASPLTPRFTISPGFGSGSRLLNILFGGHRSQHQHALDTPADIAPTCRSLSLDDTPSAPAALFTSWVRSSPTSFPVSLFHKPRLARPPGHIFAAWRVQRHRCSTQRPPVLLLALLLLPGVIYVYRQGLTVSPEANLASPVAPTRASPSPPTSSNGPYAMDETLSRSNGHPQAATTVSAKNPKAAAAMANDMNIVRRKLTGYVGFANLPNQWHRKSVRKGFNFNVMVVGTCHYHRGSKSTLMQARRRVWPRKVDPSQHPLQHVAIPAQGAQAPEP
jgi:hypothetical protein